MSSKLNGFVKFLIGALLSAAAFWILENHWQHALGLLPYALFLTCPLMHLFMHHGHGGHHGHGHGDGDGDGDGDGEGSGNSEQ